MDRPLKASPSYLQASPIVDRWKVKQIKIVAAAVVVVVVVCMCWFTLLLFPLQEGKRQNNGPALWWIDGQGNEVKWSFQDVVLNSKK